MIDEFLRAYLFAYCCVIAVPLGSLALLMLQHLTGGAWGVVIRRPLEAATRTLPIMAFMFLPIALAGNHIYPWVHDDTLGHKALYLNWHGFQIRAAVYFVIWMFLAFIFNYWSRRQDVANPESYDRRFRLLAGPGLALYGLTITFASIDWVMSLEPHWFSSIFGVLFGVGQMLSALAFAIIIMLHYADRPPYRGVINAGHLRDLGNLLLAFVMVWAYMSVSQLIIIWSGNLKEEVPYYQARVHGGWAVVAMALAGFQFAMPFLFLLGRGAKRDPRALIRIAGLILAMRLVDMYWLIAPTWHERHPAEFIVDAVVLMCLAGLWLVVYFQRLSRRQLLPVNVDASVAEDHHV